MLRAVIAMRHWPQAALAGEQTGLFRAAKVAAFE